MITNDQDLTLRKKTYNLLDTHNDTLFGKILDWFLISLITINVFAVIVETDAAITKEYGGYFYILEIFSVIIFTIEYALRYWTCPEAPGYQNDSSPSFSRLKYIFTPMALIDLLAIAPFYLAVLFNIDLRFLRVFRLIRIFKLTRYSEAMTTLLKVLREEMSSFAAAIFIMFVIMILAASGIYLLENSHQPEVYGSIPQSMWWSIVTLTTVGYGDVYPVTVLGKFFAAIIMIAGVGLVALPTGILASGFSDKLHRDREIMEEELSNILSDGVIDENEERQLQNLRKNLGLTEERFEDIKNTLLKNRAHEGKLHTANIRCPHCGEKLYETDTE